MKTEEFDVIMNEVLTEETKKLIKEQIEDSDELSDSAEGFQSLAGVVDKITDVKPFGNNGLVIIINGITSSDFDGGDIQSDLMQGLHHDLKENGFTGTYDIDINTQGDDTTLGLVITITPNDDEFSKENDMNKENIKEVEDNGELTNTFGQAMYEEEPTEVKDTNPDAEDDKEVILGDEVKESDEVKEDPGDEVDVELDINESTKKTISLNSTEMSQLLAKIIAEAVEVESPNIPMPAHGVPGIDVTKKNHKDSGRENDAALKAVEKKIKDYLSFDGNTDPEFPAPVGQGEEKVATMNTDSEDEVVELNRGRNPADLTYDQEPGETFKERAKLSLVGASEMGNSQEYANAIPSKVGENIAKVAEKRKEARVDEPIYDKEAVPVKEDPKKEDRPGAQDDAVASDILRMKQMSNYKENSQ